VARRIAELASEVSDFQEGAPKRKRLPHT
jgi:hypothetical protein